jgi:hypothetical protein
VALMQLMPFISLWDLDNCLFDDRNRQCLIDWDKTGNERYNRYDAEMASDPVAHEVEWRVITAVSQPIFITGRRERWRKVTEQMISDRLPVLRDGRLKPIAYPVIYMRPDDDNTRPVELKRRLLFEALKTRDIRTIIAAFDDVPSIVDMYREYGIPGVLLQVSDPSHTYTSQDL